MGGQAPMRVPSGARPRLLRTLRNDNAAAQLPAQKECQKSDIQRAALGETRQLG
jgi:hypothetical protein